MDDFWTVLIGGAVTALMAYGLGYWMGYEKGRGKR